MFSLLSLYFASRRDALVAPIVPAQSADAPVAAPAPVAETEIVLPLAA